MPPAKRTKKAVKEEDDDRETVCTLTERIDVSRLQEISQLWLEPSIAGTVSKLIESASEHQGYNRAVYKRKKFNKGRVYAYPSLQTLKGWITRVVAGHFYTEIDIHGCAPALVLHLSKQFGRAVPTIEQYVVDRAGLFDRVRFQTPLLADASDALLKKAFLVAMHGGSYRKFFKENCMRLDVFDCPPLASWCEECDLFASAVKHRGQMDDDESYIIGEDDKQNNENQDNNKNQGNNASWLAKSWQTLEVKIIFLIKDFFSTLGLKVGVLKHDAVLVEHPSDQPFPQQTLDQAVAYVKSVYNVDHLRLVEKKLTPTPADWDCYYGPKRLDAIKTPLDKLVHIVTHAAYKASYKRMGEQVYARHAFIPCVWAPIKPLNEYVNEVSMANCFATPPMKLFTEWATSVDHPRFPMIKPTDFDNSKIAFVNGYIDVLHGRFEPWPEQPPPFTTCHFFEKQFDETRLQPEDCPLWSNILEKQLGIIKGDGSMDRSACDLLEVLIGRMFLPIGTLDNWQVAPCVIGDANTGKSTIAKVVTAMFPPNQIGVIGSSLESTFGLENFLKKRVVICPDMPVNLHKVRFVVCIVDIRYMYVC